MRGRAPARLRQFNVTKLTGRVWTTVRPALARAVMVWPSAGSSTRAKRGFPGCPLPIAADTFGLRPESWATTKDRGATMQGMIIVRWTTSRMGHHVDAMKLADEATAYYANMAQAGQIAGYEWVNNFTGADGGMLLVRGDPQVLFGIVMSPEFGSIHLRGALYLEDWHWDLALSGSSVDEVYPGWRVLVGA